MVYRRPKAKVFRGRQSFFIAASAAEILFQIFSFVLYVNGPLSFVFKLKSRLNLQMDKKYKFFQHSASDSASVFSQRPKILLPYPCSHFYVDIKFGDRLYSKEKRRAWPLLF